MPKKFQGRRASAAREQCACDSAPLFVVSSARNRLRCLAIPIGGVARVALLAMKVGVDPGAVPGLVILRNLMCAVPVAACFQHERTEQWGQARRDLSAGYCGQ